MDDNRWRSAAARRQRRRRDELPLGQSTADLRVWLFPYRQPFTPPMASSTWVDRLRMVPISDGEEKPACRSRRTFEFNVASFNVLAESYLTPRSHPGLPEKHAETVFNSEKRRKLLLSTLERYCGDDDSSDNAAACKPADQKWDVLALQELDLIRPEEEILPAFERWGYQVVQTRNEQRRDCCAIAFDRKRFELVRYDVVQFDDLASLYTDADNTGSDDAEGQAESDGGDMRSNNRKRRGKNAPIERIEMGQGMPLSGMVRSFLRRNCAVVAQLRSVETGQSIVVASVHLYWNPGYEYVKLCQSRFLLDRVAAFASSAEGSTDRLPTVICGDTNSKPGSVVHQYFVRPHVDARVVAPWRYFWDRDAEEVYVDEDDIAESDAGPDEVSEPMTNLTLTDNKPYMRINDGDDVDISALWRSIHMKKRNGNGRSRATNKKAAPQSPPGGFMMASPPDQLNAMYCGEISPSCEDTSTAETKVDDNTSSLEVGSTEVTTPSSENLSSRESFKTGISGSSKAGIEQCDIENADARATNRDPHISPQDYEHSHPSPPVRYMLDYTLNRFTRWLRILGIDATLETMEEEKERTIGGRIALFERCRKEKRTLLTTSYKLLLRKDCPAGAYLLDPKSTESLEAAFPRLLKTHGVDLVPRTFLTRCVVCNGNIIQVHDDATKKKVFVDHGAPALAKSNEVFEVFQCDKCAQGYWWDERPNSSASRVIAQATKLFRLCLRGGVPLQCEKIEDRTLREKAMGAFNFVDVESERRHVDSNSSPRELSVIQWLRQDKLQNPYNLNSAYALDESRRKDDSSVVRESLRFTNVTSEFVGCLDYIFYESSLFDQVSRLNVPTSFRDMNSGEANSHLLPSDVWPSDHIAVGARLRLNCNEDDRSAEKVSTRIPTKEKTKSPAGHPDKCKCGCIPNILSMFEMAELRKKHREEMKRRKALEGVA